MLQPKIHFIGIGGAGMSGLARIVLAQGGAVSGSDLQASDTTEGLQALGARIVVGHAADTIRRERPTEVVISSAVPPDNEELRYAKQEGIPVMSRAALLARLMEGYTKIAVAGTHGKTTVTSMLALAVEQAGLDPTVVIGGEVHDIGSNAKLGRGDHFIAEADESDRSFLLLNPDIAVVTNVEADHLETYGSLDEIVVAFQAFLDRLPEEGLAVLCADDPIASRLRPARGRRVTYGFEEDADYVGRNVRLHPLGSETDVYEGETLLGTMVLAAPGAHNVLNGLAAVAAARALGIDFAPVARALATFRGAKRRFDVLGEAEGRLIVDDYAHHPTEIRATLAAARNTGRRVVAVFQPHRFSRTRDLMDELAASFEDADCVVLTDIYSASEAPLPGVTTERLAREVRRREGDKVAVVRDIHAVAGFLLARTRPGDIVITLGAGDIRLAGEQFHRLLTTPAPLVAHLTEGTADGDRT